MTNHHLPLTLQYQTLDRIELVTGLAVLAAVLPIVGLILFNMMATVPASFNAAWAFAVFTVWSFPAMVAFKLLVDLAIWIRFRLWLRGW